VGERRSDELAHDPADVVLFVVVEHDGSMIHGAYHHGGNAEVHARCIGAGVIEVPLFERVPQAVLDACVDEFDTSTPTEPFEIVLVDLDDIDDN
jgi:hypothetical protein